MKIQSVYIKNFKAWPKQTVDFDTRHVVLVGGNATGKSSILEALDYFFNRDAIPIELAIDPSEDIEIGIRYNGTYHKRVFSGRRQKRLVTEEPAESVDLLRVCYILVPASGITPDELFRQLSKARAQAAVSEEVLEKILQVATTAAADVIASVPEELSGSTSFGAVPHLRLGKGLDFTPRVEGTPLAERGAGYLKALVNALVTNGTYENVILGVDEIENSLSAPRFPKLIGELEQRFGQLICSTSSRRVVEMSKGAQTIPLGRNPGQGLVDALSGLEGGGTRFLLVEGKFDLPWYRTAVDLLGKSNRYIVLPAGGSNIDVLKEQMEAQGMNCIQISDGDMKSKANPKQGKFALERDCVELYTPPSLMRELFRMDHVDYRNKQAFFRSVRRVHPNRGEEAVKSAIAAVIASRLRKDDTFVVEVGRILGDEEHAEDAVREKERYSHSS